VLWKRYKKVYVRDYHSLFEIHGGSQIKENATEQMSQALVHISDKLGYTTEKVFKIYAEAQSTKAIADVAAFSIPVAILLICGYIGYRIVKRIAEAEDCSEEEAATASVYLLFYGTIVALIIAGLAYGSVHDVIMRLGAPEYMAVQDILSQLEGVIG
jgi:hypothetical protein